MEKIVEVKKIKPGIVSITLNKPEQHNAIDDEFIRLIIENLKSIADDKTTRVLLLRASGKSFCAGADLHWMQRSANFSETENYADALALAELMESLYRLPLPTIAVVQGAAYGGGVGIVACCDIAIASTAAMFCLSEVKLGLSPAVISPYVIQSIGPRAARRYFLSAEKISSGEAHKLGLIHEIVEAGDLENKSLVLAERIRANSPLAMQSAKKIVDEVSFRAINKELIENMAKQIAKLRITPEAQEGMRAFFEKRGPSWVSEDGG